MTRQPTPQNPFNRAAMGSPRARLRELKLERAVTEFVTKYADGSRSPLLAPPGGANLFDFWRDIAELAAWRASDPLEYESGRLLEVMRDGVRHDRSVVAEHVAFCRLLFEWAGPNLAASFDSFWANSAAPVLQTQDPAGTLASFGSLVATFASGDGPRARVAMSRLLERAHFEITL
jgi:hypothetical protein